MLKNDRIRTTKGGIGVNNTILEYLLKNNPDDVLSKSGVKIRKFISPIFRKVMMLFTSGKLVIVRKGVVPKDKNIIYAATHGFHDDIIFSMKTANRHTYLLYGSLMDFFKSFHGLGLWVNGVTLVDRKNKQSRNAAPLKMARVSEYGTNNIMFPEGTWNKTEAKPVQKLYPGIYDVAEKTGDLVVPIATVLDGDICYSIEGNAYDITYIDEKLSLEIVKQQLLKITKSKDLFIYNFNNEFFIRSILEDLLNTLYGDKSIIKKYQENTFYYSKLKEINKILGDTQIESLNNNLRIELIDIISETLNFVIEQIEIIEKKYSVDEESIYGNIINRSKKILKSASKQKKLSAVNELRDRMSSLAWELYKTAKRSDFESDYWKNYVNNLIKTTNGLYDHEIEDVAEYKDVFDEKSEDVFKFLNDITLTKKNAPILVSVKSKKSYHF